MSTIRFACPNCGQHLACDSSTKGATIQCPACAASVIVPNVMMGVPLSEASPVMAGIDTPTATPVSHLAAQTHAPIATSNADVTAPPKSGSIRPRLTWACENCGAEFLAPYDDFGKSIVCSNCSQATAVRNPVNKPEPIQTSGHLPEKDHAIRRKLDAAAASGLWLGIAFLLNAIEGFWNGSLLRGTLLLGWTLVSFVSGYFVTRARKPQNRVAFLAIQAAPAMAAAVWDYIVAFFAFQAGMQEEAVLPLLFGLVFTLLLYYTVRALIAVANSS